MDLLGALSSLNSGLVIGKAPLPFLGEPGLSEPAVTPPLEEPGHRFREPLPLGILWTYLGPGQRIPTHRVVRQTLVPPLAPQEPDVPALLPVGHELDVLVVVEVLAEER
jgi:hypothetical protein